MLRISREKSLYTEDEEGTRVKDLAVYIGDLASTTEQYYIAARKKIKLLVEEKCT